MSVRFNAAEPNLPVIETTAAIRADQLDVPALPCTVIRSAIVWALYKLLGIDLSAGYLSAGFAFEPPVAEPRVTKHPLRGFLNRAGEALSASIPCSTSFFSLQLPHHWSNNWACLAARWRRARIRDLADPLIIRRLRCLLRQTQYKHLL